MTVNGWLQIAFFSLAILARREAARPLSRPRLRRIVQVARAGGAGDLSRMRDRSCRGSTLDPLCASMLIFSAATMLLTYVVLRLQHLLPLNPQHLPPSPTASRSRRPRHSRRIPTGSRTVASRRCRTSRRCRSWRITTSSRAPSGMAVAVALVRGLARRSAGKLGNFYVDLVRSTLYVLLPLSLVAAFLLIQQGAIQNFKPYLTVTTLEGAKQILAMGPVASQESIKQLGTNGGGFFNANSAHPFESPTPWTNFLSVFMIFVIPSALVYMFGRMVNNVRHGWAVWAAMFLLFFGGVTTAYWAEATGNPIHAARGVDVVASATNPGGNMEGKEVRFGIANSALYATVTTDASCGCVNAMHDSFTPLGGLVPLVNMQLGEVVFGGVGAGIYGIIVMIVLTVFIAGLMVGRTPEYLGKKIQAREVQMAMLYALVFPAAILTLTGISVLLKPGLAGLNNGGPHGLSEILYAFTSTAANNGSAFAGLTGTPTTTTRCLV